MFNLTHPFNHVTIEDVKKEIMELDTACKNEYGFANHDDEFSLLVDVKNLLDKMASNEIDPSEMVEIDDDVEIPFQKWLYEYSDMENLKADNSYNWTSPLSHDINFEYWGHSENEEGYVVVRVHRMGDIRGNYTDEIILKYDSYESFLYDTMEETGKYVGVEIEHDGKKYQVSINIEWYKDGMDVTVWDEKWDEQILDMYDVYLHADNKDELIEELKKLLAENL